ncbi:zinc ribbon domain-containing protein [bacterium]|jgi:predicted nucleic acid-binding Zn ribbon protein|nr:zinc ribbon domain-containing protein [bacterium]
MVVPTYDFQCKYCSTIEEYTSPEPPVCTLCGSTMNRLWTANPVHFKGTGFYKTGG